MSRSISRRTSAGSRDRFPASAIVSRLISAGSRAFVGVFFSCFLWGLVLVSFRGTVVDLVRVFVRGSLFVGGLAACSGLGVMVSAGDPVGGFLALRVGVLAGLLWRFLVWWYRCIGSAAFVACGAFVWLWCGVPSVGASRLYCYNIKIAV